MPSPQTPRQPGPSSKGPQSPTGTRTSFQNNPRQSQASSVPASSPLFVQRSLSNGAREMLPPSSDGIAREMNISSPSQRVRNAEDMETTPRPGRAGMIGADNFPKKILSRTNTAHSTQILLPYGTRRAQALSDRDRILERISQVVAADCSWAEAISEALRPYHRGILVAGIYTLTHRFHRLRVEDVYWSGRMASQSERAETYRPRIHSPISIRIRPTRMSLVETLLVLSGEQMSPSKIQWPPSKTSCAITRQNTACGSMG